MRIAYVVERDVSRDDAVVKKIAGQVNCWRRIGHETSVFALSPDCDVAPALAQHEVAYEHWRGWRDWLIRYPRLVRRVFAWQPDIVYLRFTSYFPALRKLLNRVPTVLEINTDDLTEYRRTMTRKAFSYHRMTRGKLLRKARAFVTVTKELEKKYRIYGQATLAVGNGIDLSAAVHFPPPLNTRPRLFFLGQGQVPWHGVDKILQLAQLFPDWNFDIVGRTGSDLVLLPQNLIMHGYLAAPNYKPLLARADVAIGSLALYRAGISESSTLKIREYLAAGVPTIMAGQDTDFPQEVPFLLELPNTPDNVQTSLDRIRHFVNRSIGTRVPREAIQHLDLSNKETARVAFFARVLGQQETVGGSALLDA